MFSFVGDIIVDPFAGTGTTMLAAIRAGRNSIGVEIEPKYARLAASKLISKANDNCPKVDLKFSRAFYADSLGICLKEESPIYSCHPAIHPE